MAELLIELGCEELPASFVRKAYTDLQNLIEEKLADAGVSFERACEPVGTPRRLIVHLEGVSERQPDQTKEQRGPAIKAAFDSEGNPTPALMGFCKGQGADPAEVRREGDYVWITKHATGRATRDLLAEIIPSAIRAMSFEKSMRWGEARMRFARPIRWILASFDGKLVPFEIEGVAAGLSSRGHRFNHPGEFEVKSRAELIEQLRKREVEPDPASREARIRKDASAAASGEPMMSEALVEENVFLTEWPSALEGRFKSEYLALPRPVLITAMAKHERFFPVSDSGGTLLARFISIRNGGEEEAVRQGNEWVLNARFNDAKFFFDEDAKHSLDEFLEKTDGVLFQEKLGSVRERADRLANLTAEIAKATGAGDDEVEFARLAGLYCKADLSTGLVSELPSLQGQIGGEYAKREGFPDPVCWAVASHYDLSKNPNPDCPGGRTAIRLLLADQLDKLAGYLGVGLAPTGSSDPFGLRRAASLLIEAAWTWEAPGIHDLDYQARIAEAIQEYRQSGHDIAPQKVARVLEEVFVSRYEALLPEVRHDVLEAAVQNDALNPRLIRLKVRALEILAQDPAFIQTATRPINIVQAARSKGIEVAADVQIEVMDVSRIESAEGVKLAEAVRAAEQELHEAVTAEDPARIAQTLKSLEPPINAFFESTMVMAENEEVRHARLALLQVVSQALFTAGDFSKLVVEG